VPYHAPMTYTFLHRGVVMGESDLSAKPRHRRQKIGAFCPTEYGRTLLPRVTCVLSAGLALKTHLKAMAPKAKDLSPSQLESLLYESEAGRMMIDVGRVLSEVELRTPDGRLVEFENIAFSDVNEIRRVGKAVGMNADEELRDQPPDAPQFIVSVSLRPKSFSVFAAGRGAVRAVGRRFEN
jgi:hypothetical protein